MNDDRVCAAVLNRHGSLGPDTQKRSRGELPLEAADHAEAVEAARALAMLEPRSYRTFNIIVADNIDAFWIRSDGIEITAAAIPPGLSMITANDLNDTHGSARIRHHLDLFRRAPVPAPESGDWDAWKALLGSRQSESGADHGGAMTISTDYGFGTVSSSLIAIPNTDRTDLKPQWLYCAGCPDEQAYEEVRL